MRLLIPALLALAFAGAQANEPEKPLGPAHRLTTPWTLDAEKAAVPLPEYPSPQLVRKEWLNLNGHWDYWGGKGAPDARDVPSTAPAFPAKVEQVRVPYPVESRLSGIERLGEVNLWYRRSFEIPAAWAGQRMRVNFGAVDRVANVYVNGTRVGFHDGGYAAFSFDITDHLKTGRNELVVSAFDPSTGDGMVGKQSLKPGGIFYTPSSGIWRARSSRTAISTGRRSASTARSGWRRVRTTWPWRERPCSSRQRRPRGQPRRRAFGSSP